MSLFSLNNSEYAWQHLCHPQSCHHFGRAQHMIARSAQDLSTKLSSISHPLGAQCDEHTQNVPNRMKTTDFQQKTEQMTGIFFCKIPGGGGGGDTYIYRQCEKVCKTFKGKEVRWGRISWGPAPGPVYSIYPGCAYCKMDRQVKYQEAYLSLISLNPNIPPLSSLPPLQFSESGTFTTRCGTRFGQKEEGS